MICRKVRRNRTVRTLRHLKLEIVAIGILMPIAAIAQQRTTPSNLPPARDTAFTQRAVIRPDSLPAPWRGMGRLADDSTERTNEITKQGMRLLTYGHLGEALMRATPWTPLSHGGFGQHDAVSIMGGTNVDIGVSVNGRSVADPWSRAFQLVQAQPVAYERVELLTGVDAVGLAPSMTLSALNLQMMIHNTATPYTALSYHQGGGDIIGVDASFSQNVAENLNVTLGVRRSGARGRYLNTGFDIWNVRAGVRWTMSERDHLDVNYTLASLNTDLWGGLRSIGLDGRFTEEAAPPVNVELRDETRRHDLTASYVRLLSSDSSSILSTSVYASTDALLRLRDSTLYTSVADSARGIVIRGLMAGGLVRLDQRIGNMRLRLGAGIDHHATDGTVYTTEVSNVVPQAFGHLVLPIAGGVAMRGAARLALEASRVVVGAGVGLDVSATPTLMRFDVATIERTPTPAEGIGLQPERHVLLSAQARSASSGFAWSATAFARLIDAPILATVQRTNEVVPIAQFANGTSRRVIGAVADMLWRTGPFEFRPVVRVTTSSTNDVADERFALAMAELRVAYVYEVGRNSVRLGVSGTALSNARFMQYIAPSWTYADPVVSTGGQYDGLNAFLLAVVGNATVRASFDNILGQRWYTTSLAPEIARSIRLSVDWSFFD